jgi:hypothetical protein
VMNTVHAPQDRHGVHRDVLAIDGKIERDKTGDQGDGIGQLEQR